MPFATAAVVVPTLMPGEPVELIVTLDRELHGNKYDVSPLKNAALLLAGAEVVVIAHTATTVTLRVVAKQGLVGAGVVYVICN